jgi:hypothetical protein
MSQHTAQLHLLQFVIHSLIPLSGYQVTKSKCGYKNEHLPTAINSYINEDMKLRFIDVCGSVLLGKVSYVY